MNIKEELEKYELELTVLEEDLWVVRGIKDKLIEVLFCWDGRDTAYLIVGSIITMSLHGIAMMKVDI